MANELAPYANRHLINGTWREGEGTFDMPVYEPATGRLLTTVKAASLAQVDEAVEAASVAFEAWSALSINRRAEMLLKVRTLLDARADELAHVLSMDNGKTLAEARGEIGRAAEAIAGAIGAPTSYYSQSGNVAPGLDARRVRYPLGVCVAVTPFNFPVMNPSMFSAWALVCGNTLVLKPSEQTPIATNTLVEIFREAGIPDGVLSVVHGGADVGERLVAHPKTVAVTCITSSPVAKAIYLAGSAAGKRVQANGGGKNPYVVMPDCDLDRTVDGIADGAFGMSGQRCLAASRCIVVGDVYDAFVARLVERAKAFVLGPSQDPKVTMGPVVSAASKARVVKAIETAKANGGTILLDGREHANRVASASDEGYLIGPSIVTGLSPKDPVDRQEVFGPFLVIHRVATFDEAIRLANDTEFGNAGAIYTESGRHAARFERECRAGNIGVNTFPAPPMNFQMGGMGTSFYGDVHTLGDGYMLFFTDHKVVVSRW